MKMIMYFDKDKEDKLNYLESFKYISVLKLIDMSNIVITDELKSMSNNGYCTNENTIIRYYDFEMYELNDSFLNACQPINNCAFEVMARSLFSKYDIVFKKKNRIKRG